MYFTDGTHKSLEISKKIRAVPFLKWRKARETLPSRGSLFPRARGTKKSPTSHQVPGLPGTQVSSHPIQPRSNKPGCLKRKKSTQILAV